MNCDFIKSLTTEQKTELRKLLQEEETPKYRVEVEYHDNGNIKSLREYLGDQQHGKYIEWHENGQKWFEKDYHQDQRHGKAIWWHEDGQKECERDYAHGKLVKEYKV
jgi:antitoxin component YwqK of YwqJK toxin-antitoxin module